MKFVSLATCVFAAAAAAAAAATAQTTSGPSVRLFPGQNQVYNVARPGQNSTTLRYLGSPADMDACKRACVAHTEERCWSFTWHGGLPAASPFHNQCFGVVAPRWSPTPDTPGIVSGYLDWPCRDDRDCSLNGKCNHKDGAATCFCRPSWKGNRCEQLALVPATRGADGYRGTDGGHNTSSWGGAVLYDEHDQQWHMWAAEMTEHCGIGAWAQNSRIIHAVSPAPAGPYVRKQVVWEVFSHEPEVVRGPNGEYVMYFTASLRSQHGDCNCCRAHNASKCDGSTGPGDCPSSFSSSSSHSARGRSRARGGRGRGRRRRLDADPSWMSYATSPDGPWSTPVQIFKGYEGSDTNFSPTILKNGSLVAIWREWTTRGSRCYLATASDWKDPSTYRQHIDAGELWPDLGAAGTEDPFVYRDADGNFHAVFHHMYGYDTTAQWWLDAAGGHAFSPDGASWTYTGVAWGPATTTEQGDVVQFTDGTSFRFTRRERPHLVFREDGTISHLTSAAQYGDGKIPGQIGDNGDACYTLVQPVATS